MSSDDVEKAIAERTIKEWERMEIPSDEQFFLATKQMIDIQDSTYLEPHDKGSTLRVCKCILNLLDIKHKERK